jgi:hypothetical protein
LVFSDGSVYHYFASAANDVRVLTNALWHGVTFNAQFRRALNVGGAYEKFPGTIPSSATLIYDYPPYAGTDPGDCPACVTGATITLSVNSFATGPLGPGYPNAWQLGFTTPGAARVVISFASPTPMSWNLFFKTFMPDIGIFLIDGVSQPMTFNSPYYESGNVLINTDACIPVVVDVSDPITVHNAGGTIGWSDPF